MICRSCVGEFFRSPAMEVDAVLTRLQGRSVSVYLTRVDLPELG